MEAETKTAPHVLVAEDEPLAAMAIEDFLGAAGYRTTWAADGQRALAAFERDPAGILIADIVMPEMNGIELLDRVRALAPSLPAIVMSGYGPMIPGGAKLPEDERTVFLRKPVNLDLLLRKLRGLHPGADA